MYNGMTHRRLWWLWLPLLTGACSEYEFKASDDINDADDTSERDDQETGSPPQGDDCLDQIIEGYATSTDADCENEVETGTFNPEVEWSKGGTETLVERFRDCPVIKHDGALWQHLSSSHIVINRLVRTLAK